MRVLAYPSGRSTLHGRTRLCIFIENGNCTSVVGLGAQHFLINLSVLCLISPSPSSILHPSLNASHFPSQLVNIRKIHLFTFTQLDSCAYPPRGIPVPYSSFEVHSAALRASGTNQTSSNKLLAQSNAAAFGLHCLSRPSLCPADQCSAPCSPL